MKSKTPYDFDKGIKVSGIVTLLGIIIAVVFGIIDIGQSATVKVIVASIGVLLFLIGFAYLIYCVNAKHALEKRDDR